MNLPVPSSRPSASRDGPEAEDPIWSNVDREADRHAEILRGLIAATGHSEAEIEARLGWEPQQIRRWLERPQELTYDRFLAILDAIGVGVADFFVLYSRSETDQ